MRYMGGKAMIARHIVSAILADTAERGTWFEPFVGGGNVLERAAPYFSQSIAMDAHEDLMLMWLAVNAGWEPPPFVSREKYQKLRHAEPSALRGFAGFGASFGGKWFNGYAVSKIDKKHPVAEGCRAAHKTVIRQGRVFRQNGVSFTHGNFGSWTPDPGSVVYCDPPYQGTTGYSTGEFDHGAYYKTLTAWANSGCHVYASEYAIPAEVSHTRIWSRERKATLKGSDNRKSVTENLYRIGTR